MVCRLRERASREWSNDVGGWSKNKRKDILFSGYNEGQRLSEGEAKSWASGLLLLTFFFFFNELQEAERLAIEKSLKICDNLEYLLKTMGKVAYHGKIKIALVELR